MRAEEDGRQFRLSLTTGGRKAFVALDRQSQCDMGAMLRKLDPARQCRVVAAMQVLETLIGGEADTKPDIVLRSHRPGDMGWVVARHGALYAEEYGWDISFEALVTEIVAQFLKNFDPAREHCWIAEMDGEPVGSVFLVNGSDGVAKLRLLIVDPKARGHGVGRELVEECIRFARAKGYRKITLWTQNILTGARHIYEAAGFKRVAEQPHDGWGQPLVGETWELDFQGANR
jgi:GNAT superfamily N-acetyltransferase